MKVDRVFIFVCSINFIVIANLWAQMPPTLISPRGTIFDPTPEFIWHSVANIDSFNLVVEQAKQFINIVTAETTYTPSTIFTPGIYNWQVRSKDASGNWGNFSSPLGFELFYLTFGWEQKASMPTQVSGKYVRDGGALVSTGGILYAFRGYRSNEYYKYLLNTNLWVLMESIPFGWNPGATPPTINRKRVDQGGALCFDGGNIIYATKGGGTTEFWAYNITQNSWCPKPFVPSERGLRGGTALTYCNEKVYLLAGEQSKDAQFNFFEYDPMEDTWRILNSIPLIPDQTTFRDGSCIVQLNDIIYALKGGGKHNYFWAYDVATNAWVQKESIPLIHPHNQTGDDADLLISVDRVRKTKVKDGGAMTTDGNVIYAIKGGGAQDFWKYTPSTNHWTPLETIPRLHNRSVPKAGAGLSYTNGMVWLLKGNNTSEFWKYTPLLNIKSQISNINTVTAEANLKVCPTIDIIPNPFTKLARIRYTVPVAGKVSIKLYNASGRLIKTLVNGHQKAGSYALEIRNWSLDIPHGVYFLKYETETTKSELKLIRQ